MSRESLITHYIGHSVSNVIMYLKKLLDSDWLRAVQFKGNTSAKTVTFVQVTHHQ